MEIKIYLVQRKPQDQKEKKGEWTVLTHRYDGRAIGLSREDCTLALEQWKQQDQATGDLKKICEYRLLWCELPFEVA